MMADGAAKKQVSAAASHGGEGKGVEGDVNKTMQISHVVDVKGTKDGAKKEKARKKNGKGTYRKIQREKQADLQEPSRSEMGRKRVVEDLMDLDAGLATKKARKTEEVGNVSATKTVKAGLSEQLRGDQ